MNSPNIQLLQTLLNDVTEALDDIPGSQRRIFAARINKSANALAQAIQSIEQTDPATVRPA
jgi:hypothetical protein